MEQQTVWKCPECGTEGIGADRGTCPQCGHKNNRLSYWDCKSCWAKGIRAELRECPVCGQRRPKDVSYYLGDDDPAALVEAVRTPGPTWICPFCSQENDCAEQKCTKCGTPREESEARSVDLMNLPNRMHRRILPTGVPVDLLLKFIGGLILFVVLLWGGLRIIHRDGSSGYRDTEISGLFWKSSVRITDGFNNLMHADQSRYVTAEGNAATEPYYADYTLEDGEREYDRKIVYYLQLQHDGSLIRLSVSRDVYDALCSAETVTYRCETGYGDDGPFFFIRLRGSEIPVGTPV
ncbi:MAG: hypothetical protein IKH27_07005 [Oscillospiraceae bacterium]|nr:hypothetical protein [Oscillospiraceae bacterium]